MQTKAKADEAAARARAWLFDACFPFWATAGVDPRGGFRERLTLEGAAIVDASSRVRVQARQTYVFAEAALLGWDRAAAAALVRRGVDTLLGACRRTDHLFGRLVRPGAGLVDAEPDLYDNAFCLMALGWAARALSAPPLLDEADRTLAALDRNMAHPAGGYAESLPPRRPRRQNPHMHLLEALLALHAADPARGYLVRAERLVVLCESKFIEMSHDVLIEEFDDDWTPRVDAAGVRIEPGHMFEWSWLLGAFARAAGTPPRPAQAALYRAASRFVDARGLAPQAVLVGGAVADGSRRAWPQTETLKAHCAAQESGDATALDRALTTFDSLFADYLSGVPSGGWRDHFDGDGAPIASDMPASTGYHVVLALAEFLRVVCATGGSGDARAQSGEGTDRK